MSDGFSLKEMNTGEPQAKGADAAPGHLTLADMDPSARPDKPPTPGILANDASDSDAVTAMKYGSTAMAKLLSQIPGYYGNLNEGAKALGAAVPAGYNALFDNANFSQDFHKQLENAQRGAEIGRTSLPAWASAIPGPEIIPSGSDVENAIFAHTGQYKPQSALGDIGMSAAEGLGASIMPSGAATKTGELAKVGDAALTALPKAKAYLANLIAGAGGGAGAEATSKVTDNPWLQGIGGLFGSLLPGHVAKATTGRTLGTAERLSGQAMRDAVADPASTQAALESSPDAIPGVRLSSAQVTRDPGLAAIETTMANKTRNEGTFASELAQDKADSGAALETAAGKAAKQTAKEPWREANLGANDPAELSTKARDVFTKAEEAADKVQSDAWADPALDGALMHKNKTINRLREAISDMPVTDQEVVGGMYGKILDKIEANYANQIPMKEMQSLRSSILADQRSMGTGANPNYNGARVMGKLANSVSDILTEDKNYFYHPPGFQDAYDTAKKATANYYKTFGPLKDLMASPMAGVEKVAPEATLQKIMRGDNAAQNVRSFRAAVGPDADALLSDYVVSDLTEHGMKLPQPDQVEKYMTDNAGKIGEVPGLEARLNGIKSASRSDLVSKGIAEHAANPDKLAEFLDANKGDVKAVFATPQQKELVEGIKDASRRLSRIPEGEIGSKETFNKVTNGRVLDVLLGSSMANSITTGTGLMVGHAVASKFPEAAGWAEGVGALFGGHSDKINELARKALLGDNQDRVKELLMEGLRDPKVGAMLMKKADPDNLAVLFQKVNPNIASTMPVIAESAKKPGYAKGGQVQLNKSRTLLRKATAPLPAYARG